MHVHLGIVPALLTYLMWAAVHIVVQVFAIQIHGTKFGQALAVFG